MGPILISLMILTALGFFGYYGGQRLEMLRKAPPENRLDHPVERLKGLWQYGILQQRLIATHKDAGWMHALIFWGFLVLLLRNGMMLLTGYWEHLAIPGILGHAYTLAKDVVEVVVLFMIGYAVYRRVVLKPERLTNSFEAYLILSLIGFLMISDFVYDGAKFVLMHDLPHVAEELRFAVAGGAVAMLMASWPTPVLEALYQGAYWTHVAAVLFFAVFLTRSKHMHVITALPNVFLRALGQPGLAVTKLDLTDEDAEKFGTVTIEDLTWKQRLDLMTCTECGRCYSSCPTYVTHKPLSLKGLNTDLKHHLYDVETAHTEAVPLIENVVSSDTLWACTTCGFCETACPVFIEQVPRIVSMRQNETLMESRYPDELKKFYSNLERNFNPWGIGYDQRAAWAKDLDVPVMADLQKQGTPVEVLYFVGCMGSYDERSQKVAKALVKILKAAGVSFAILGKEERCTGDSARRLGNEFMFQELAQYNVDLFNSYDVKTVLTTCPHCFNTIAHEYPQFGGNYRVLHHTEFIADLIKQGKIKVSKQFQDVLYHDSCYMGRYNQVYEAPRVVVDLVATNGVKEFHRNRESSFCCGAGGGRMWMEEHIGEQINQERVREGLEQKPQIIASNCPFCLTMLKDGVIAHNQEEAVKTMDLAELVAQALITPATEPPRPEPVA